MRRLQYPLRHVHKEHAGLDLEYSIVNRPIIINQLHLIRIEGYWLALGEAFLCGRRHVHGHAVPVVVTV